MMILKTKQLMKAFGGLKAINKIDFELKQGEIRVIIGPNGSGKSTFFNLVSGVMIQILEATLNSMDMTLLINQLMKLVH